MSNDTEVKKISVKVEITLENGKQLVLDEQEARDLYIKLRNVFEQPAQIYPVAPQPWTYPPNAPWTVTYSSGASTTANSNHLYEEDGCACEDCPNLEECMDEVNSEN